jgi:asparagine synthase (glutamine-hydrolysing)
VSVGSSLSGGLDSSLVVMVIDDLKKGTTQKQNTFSAVFPGYEKDERKYMDYIIAKTQVTPHFVTPNEIGLINNLQKLNWHQEEPYGSSSIYAQYCVMELARKNNTTVLLDGQGADEILAGYHHYFLSFFNEKSKKDKKQYHTELDAYNHKHKLNTINGLAKKNTGYYVRKYIPGLEKSLKGIRLSAQQKSNSFYNNDFFNQYKKSSFEPDRKLFDTLNESLYHSSYTFGLQQLLRYADRNSMAHSVEVRLPFLYHELAEFLITLPAEFKLHEGWTKYILRDTFNNLPKEIGWRVDKIGYEPPQKNWLQHPVIEELIREGRKKFISNGILHSKHTNAKITAPGANDINQLNWRELMAFSMF